jgi:2-oxoglutarate ferredoxin oxidoreductase subunit beta
MTISELNTPMTRKDFASDLAVRWCPGCGDFAILSQVQKMMPEVGVPRENIVLSPGSVVPAASRTI